MKILAHRGLWYTPAERNTFAALSRALEMGFGIETDVRDQGGRLCISHDVPATEVVMLDDFLNHYAESNHTATLALNIKADGLCDMLLWSLQRFSIRTYYVFDMSVPDTLGYLRLSMPVFLRRSELEGASALQPDAAGIWLDELTRPWLTAETLCEVASDAASVSIVSPEIHGRDPQPLWAALRKAKEILPSESNLSLCTDLPEHARRFFL